MIHYGWFKDQLARMGQAFGVHDRRIESSAQVYHEAIEPRCSESQLARAVEHALVSCDKMPTIKALLEIARMFPDPKTPGARSSCHDCGGSGIVNAKSQDGYRPIFKCPSCLNCSAAYPVWDDALLARGWFREIDVGWNEYDKHQAKGLALMGKGSKAWSFAPAELRAAVEPLVRKHAAPAGMTSVADALNSQPDPQREADRARNIHLRDCPEVF